jgi:trehalose-6-phosphate synthase
VESDCVPESSQHNHDEMRRFYRKEFVVARDDEQGAFILSVFTGTARELKDALLVNLNDIEQTA